MTTETDWKPRVEALIRRNFRALPKQPLLRETAFRGDDGLAGYDLDVLQLVMDVEDELDIEISDAEDEALFTVGDLFDLIERKLVTHADI